ncbi:uncharacterized protein LOC135493668 [Lineus longissimus]|uniref:uncharacterized protein LOC135493668 n=1 Tax=Lineus longissimus TaxID=88925 RepID=UPI002B4EABA5
MIKMSKFEGNWGPVGADCAPLQDYLVLMGVPQQLIDVYSSVEQEISVEDDQWTISIAPPVPEEAGEAGEVVADNGPDMSVKHNISIGKKTEEKEPGGNIYLVSGKLTKDKSKEIFTMTRELKTAVPKDKTMEGVESLIETQVHEILLKTPLVMTIKMDLVKKVKGKGEMRQKGVQVFQRKVETPEDKLKGAIKEKAKGTVDSKIDEKKKKK